MKKLPNLETVHPPYAEGIATYNRVNTTKAEKQAAALAISERVRTNRSESGNIEENRLRVLKGLEAEPEVLPDADQLVKVRKEIEAINRNLPGLHGEVQQEKQVASRLLCQSVEGDHAALVTDFFTKLSALNVAHCAYVDFLDAVEATGASTGSLRPIWPSAFGHPRDASAAYHWAFKEGRENGHINYSVIPKAVR